MPAPDRNGKMEKSAAQWRAELSPEQYRIARLGGTEPPFSSPYNNEKRSGLYRCVCCGEPLFTSNAKYESGSGWPSFFEPVADDVVAEAPDHKLAMPRTEIRCARCDAHLGHVFPDGPQPTGLRYCTNGGALAFEPEADETGADETTRNER